jgi:hypothetical protein
LQFVPSEACMPSTCELSKLYWHHITSYPTATQDVHASTWLRQSAHGPQHFLSTHAKNSSHKLLHTGRADLGHQHPLGCLQHSHPALYITSS